MTSRWFVASLIISSLVEVRSRADVSRVDLEIPNDPIQVSTEVTTKPNSEFDFSASSWYPAHFKTQDRAGQPTSFQPSSLPMFNISTLNFSLFSHLADSIRGQLALKTGVGYRSMTREENVQLAAANSSATQAAYLVPFNVGLEYIPRFTTVGGFSAYLQADLLPTLIMIEDSSIGNGSTSIGLLSEFGIGARYGFGATYTSILTAGYSLTRGSLSGSDASGGGVVVGLGFPI